MATPPAPPTLLLIKHTLFHGHDSHYAGGVHLLNCLAHSLLSSSEQLAAVHTFSTAPRGVVLHHLVTQNLLTRVQRENTSSGEVVSWTSSAGLHHHVAVTQGTETASAELLLTAAASTARQLAAAGATGLAVLDVDSLQHARVRPGGVEQQQDEEEAEAKRVPFMLAVAQQLTPWPLLVLVQNIHHGPFGPCGTGPRSPAVLQGWQQVRGVLCVSQFVAAYVQQHALPLLPQLLQQEQQQAVHVVHPAACGVWGPGPFEDLGSTVAEQLWGPEGVPAAGAGAGAGAVVSSTPHGSAGGVSQSAGDQQQQQQQQQQVPVVGMLKLTREKGSDLFLALAGQLPGLQFVAVCAEPSVQAEAARAGLTNLRLLEPAADVSAVLRGMSLLLVPSVLHEAFGMVALDAMLHGLPALVAAAGALPEAAAGAAAAVLPVVLAEFPPQAVAACSCLQHRNSTQLDSAQPEAASSTGSCVDCWLHAQRHWGSRLCPAAQPQHVVDSWAGAIREVLASRATYDAASRRSGQAALRELQQGHEQLAALVQWLLQRAGA